MKALINEIVYVLKKNLPLGLLNSLIKEHKKLDEKKTEPDVRDRMKQFYTLYDERTSEIDAILRNRPEYEPFLLMLSNLEDFYGIACGESINREHRYSQRISTLLIGQRFKTKEEFDRFIDNFTVELEKARKAYLNI